MQNYYRRHNPKPIVKKKKKVPANYVFSEAGEETFNGRYLVRGRKLGAVRTPSQMG